MISKLKKYWAWPIALALAFTPVVDAAVKADDPVTFKVMVKPSKQNLEEAKEQLGAINDILQEEEWKVYADPIQKNGKTVGYTLWLDEELKSDREPNKQDVPRALALLVSQHPDDKDLAESAYLILSRHVAHYKDMGETSDQQRVLNWSLEKWLGADPVFLARESDKDLRKFLIKNPEFVKQWKDVFEGASITYNRYGQALLVMPNARWGWKGFKKFVDENNVIKPGVEVEANEGIVEREVVAENEEIDPASFFAVGMMSEDPIDEGDGDGDPTVDEGDGDGDGMTPFDEETDEEWFTKNKRRFAGEWDPQTEYQGFAKNHACNEVGFTGKLNEVTPMKLAEGGCHLILYTPWKGEIRIEDSDTLQMFIKDYRSGAYKPQEEDYQWFQEYSYKGDQRGWELYSGQWMTPEGDPTTRQSDYLGWYTPQQMFEGYSAGFGLAWISKPGHYYKFVDGVTWNGKDTIENLADWEAWNKDAWNRDWRIDRDDWREEPPSLGGG